MSEQFPAEIKLRPSKLKAGVMLLFSFVMLPIASAGENTVFLVIFGLLMIVALLNLFTDFNVLKVDANGFTVTRLFGCKSYSWHDVTEFGIHSVNILHFIPIVKQVTFSLDQDKGKVGKWVSKKIIGGSEMLPDTYGMKAEKLIELLLTYQVQALAAGAGHSRFNNAAQNSPVPGTVRPHRQMAANVGAPAVQFGQRNT